MLCSNFENPSNSRLFTAISKKTLSKEIKVKDFEPRRQGYMGSSTPSLASKRLTRLVADFYQLGFDPVIKIDKT